MAYVLKYLSISGESMQNYKNSPKLLYLWTILNQIKNNVICFLNSIHRAAPETPQLPL